MTSTDSRRSFDFGVIGAGIAGASVAAELADFGSVVLLEMEDQPGYHTTGRSAAVFSPGYGPPPIRALTRASADFFHNPPEGFSDVPLLTPLDVIMVARHGQETVLETFLSEVSIEGDIIKLSADAIYQRHPLIRHGYAVGGALDTAGSSIDVHALHRGYLKAFKNAGGALITQAEVRSLERRNQIWQIDTAAGSFSTPVVINASGAWANKVGELARAEPIGLIPKRRTALIIDAPESVDVDRLPLVVDIEEEFYMKGDAGRLLISPANEDPMEPCDVQPEEIDIALCVDRIERAFDIQVGRVSNKWAGLRSFVGDKSPVVGYSQSAEGFFWLAGQGGYGIQSSPALSRYAASLALGNEVPSDILKMGLSPISISPARLATAVSTEPQG